MKVSFNTMVSSNQYAGVQSNVKANNYQYQQKECNNAHNLGFKASKTNAPDKIICGLMFAVLSAFSGYVCFLNYKTQIRNDRNKMEENIELVSKEAPEKAMQIQSNTKNTLGKYIQYGATADSIRKAQQTQK